MFHGEFDFVKTGGLSHPKLTVRQGSRLSRKDAAEYLGLKPDTLKAWQRTGFGPPSIKVGSRRFYELPALAAFARKRHAH